MYNSTRTEMEFFKVWIPEVAFLRDTMSSQTTYK